MRLLTGSLCLAALTVAAAAQQPEAGRAEELRRAERRLDENRYEVTRLIEMRLRHDLGLSGGLDDSMVRVDGPVTASNLDRMRAELENEVASATVMRQRYEQLRRAVQQLKADAAAEETPGQERFETTGPIGTAQPPDAAPVRRAPAAQPPAAPGPEPRAPEQRPRAQLSPDVLGPLTLDPLRAQIHGSKDHLRVAQALFGAGQALMDRAEVMRERGEHEVAKELDLRARSRLEHAVKELTPLLSGDSPAFVALFYLGRCRELLFRLDERHEGLSLEASPSEYRRREQAVREPFLQISARDVVKDGPAGAVEVLGPWGQAAKTAMEHFRWMNLNAGYDVAARIDALTWPGDESK